MRPTLAAAACALALLGACGGGDSDTALTPGDSATPTASVHPGPTSISTPTASGGPKHTYMKDNDGGAPPLTPLLPRHRDAFDEDATFPAGQLSADWSGETIVSCADYAFPLDRLITDPVPSTRLSKAVLKALPQVDEPGWTVVVAEQALVVAVQDLATQDGDGRGTEWWYAYREYGYDDAKWAMDDEEPGPFSCDLDRVLPGLNNSMWSLTAAPKPGDRSLSLRVWEWGCGDDKSPVDRLKVAILQPTPKDVRIAIGFSPLNVPEDFICKQPKYWPYTLELPEPLGDRTITNVGYYPESRATFDA